MTNFSINSRNSKRGGGSWEILEISRSRYYAKIREILNKLRIFLQILGILERVGGIGEF